MNEGWEDFRYLILSGLIIINKILIFFNEIFEIYLLIIVCFYGNVYICVNIFLKIKNIIVKRFFSICIIYLLLYDNIY